MDKHVIFDYLGSPQLRYSVIPLYLYFEIRQFGCNVFPLTSPIILEHFLFRVTITLDITH